MRSIAIAVALIAIIALPAPAQAQAPCAADAFQQHDMAGTYISFEDQIRVTVGPCGGTDVLWSNPYGTHQAGYYSVEHLQGGGIIARVFQPDPVVRSLDNRNVIALKPADPGHIQAITMGPFGDDIKIYRLRKIA